MALWSAGVLTGLDAAKPTLVAEQDGVLYCATDTKAIYRWNGSGLAWVDFGTAGGTGIFIRADGTVDFTADQSMNSNKLTDLTDPTNPQDAATKAYADLLLSISGAPSNAKYLTAQAEAGLSAEVNIGALSEGLLYTTPAAGVATVTSKAIGTTAGTIAAGDAAPKAHAASHGAAQSDALSGLTYAQLQNVSATDKVLGRSTAGAGAIEEIACTAAGRALLDDANAAAQRTTLGILQSFIIACSDETTAITTGTAKVTFRMPFAFTVTDVRASLTTTSSSGNPAIDINEGGVSILSTTITIDSGELTSTTAATPPVISDSALADDAEITIDIDTAGTGAKGLKVTIIGRQT